MIIQWVPAILHYNNSRPEEDEFWNKILHPRIGDKNLIELTFFSKGNILHWIKLKSPMKKILKLVVTAMIFLPHLGWSQVKATPEKSIDVQSFTGKLPFDIPLKFKTEYKSTISVENVSVIELDKHGCPIKRKQTPADYAKSKAFFKQAFPNTGEKYLAKLFPEKTARPKQSITPKVEQKNGKTTVEFTLEPLEPNHSYSIVLVNKPTSEDVKRFLGFAKLSNTLDDSISYYKQLGFDPADTITCQIKGRPFIFREFILQMKPQILSFNNTFDKEMTLAAQTIPNCGTVSEKNLGDIQKKLLDCEPCEDVYKFLLKPDTIPQLVNALRNLTDPTLLSQQILTGLLPLNAAKFSKPLEPDDRMGRMNNFVSSYASFNELVEIVRVIRSTDPHPQLDALYAELMLLQPCFERYKAAFDNIQKAFASLTGSLSNNPLLASLNVINATTNVYSFETRNEYSFTADFGLIYYGEKLNNSFAPYLGVHVNFRYIDRNIPWRYYPNKTLAHKLSFHMGTTLISLKDEGRTDNFLKNSGFMTGMGYRLGHVVRANAGVLWFNIEDPNPLIANKSLAATPYVGISFDLSVKSFMNGFNTFF
jgi:hypothetical protein